MKKYLYFVLLVSMVFLIAACSQQEIESSSTTPITSKSSIETFDKSFVVTCDEGRYAPIKAVDNVDYVLIQKVDETCTSRIILKEPMEIANQKIDSLPGYNCELDCLKLSDKETCCYEGKMR